MTEFWSRIGPSELIPLVAIVGGLRWTPKTGQADKV